MSDLTLFDKFHAGDFVEHRAALGVVWEVMAVEPYNSGGPQATLKYVGGDPTTFDQICRVFNVFAPSARTCWVRDLIEANAMLTLAAIAQQRVP